MRLITPRKREDTLAAGAQAIRREGQILRTENEEGGIANGGGEVSLTSFVETGPPGKGLATSTGAGAKSGTCGATAVIPRSSSRMHT